MSLKHVSNYCKNLPDACKDIDLVYIDVPIDGKRHETRLIGDESGENQGHILRAIGGVCGQVLNKKTGQSLLFISPPEVDL